jgi:signal transduction histidine kinase
VSICKQRFQGEQWVGFSVADTGPGIPPDEQAQLFSRFFRGMVGRESGMPGTGLGLAIAKQIVDLHAGRIEVASEGVPGRGTTFSVWLPVEERRRVPPSTTNL